MATKYVDSRACSKKLATEAVVKILPERVRFAVRQRGKEGETIDDLLGRMTKDMSEGEVHRDFLKAAEAQSRKRPNEAAGERQSLGWWKAKKTKNQRNQGLWQYNQRYNQGYRKEPEPENIVPGSPARVFLVTRFSEFTSHL